MESTLIPLTTKRLVVRTLRRDDLDGVFDTLRPETSGGRVFEKKTIEDAERWLTNRIAEQEACGYSIWAVESVNRDFIGVCGLIPWKPQPMICYAVRKRFQGSGYATEAARAVIARAAEELGPIISTVRRSNVASIRVAEKIGMRRSATPFADDPDLLSFVFP